MGVSENRGPYYSTLNSRILIIRRPNKVPLIFGNSHMCFFLTRRACLQDLGSWPGVAKSGIERQLNLRALLG